MRSPCLIFPPLGSRTFWLRTLLLALVVLVAARAQDRTELVNRSGQPWTLALVEGAHAGRGTLTLMDKFNGRTMGTLVKVGDTITLPPQGRLLVVFNREGGYMYRDFILMDSLGYYAEYVATVEFLSTPTISIELVDHHVGPPLDRSDDSAVKQFISDAIEVGRENIIIHPNDLRSGRTEVKNVAVSPKMDGIFTPMR
jgi:hypothetical protein